MPESTETKWMRIPAAAKYMAMSVRTVRRMLERGDLPSYRPTIGTIVLCKNDMDEVMKDHKVRLGWGNGFLGQDRDARGVRKPPVVATSVMQ